MTCPTHQGEATLPAGAGIVGQTGTSSPGVDGRTMVVRPTGAGPWTVHAFYASPKAAALQVAQGDKRAPAYLELRWSHDGARDVVNRVPIPAVGAVLSVPAPPACWVGRYRLTGDAVSLIVQATPGRPAVHWSSSADSGGAAAPQVIPDFASRIAAGSSDLTTTLWLDADGATIDSGAAREFGGVPPLARFYVYNTGPGFAFEVVT